MLLLSIAAVGGCSSTLGDDPVAALIEVSPYSASIEVGRSVTLYASVLDVGGRVIPSNRQLSWTSSNPSVATIDANGKVTGVSPGSARITVRSGKLAGSAAITVLIPVPARVDIPAGTTSLSRGDTIRLRALAISAADSTYNGRGFTWRSDDPSVVTVTPSADSATALVLAIAPGSAVVSAANFGVAGQVTLRVAPDPVIRFAQGTIAFAGTSRGSDPAPQLVAITNSGGGTLRGVAVSSIAYGQGASGWLQGEIVTPPEGAQLRLTASLHGITTGSYSATVTVTSTSPAVQPRAVNVTLSVAPPPFLTLSSTSVSIGAVIGGSPPPPQSVSITNGGGGTLTGLAVSSPVTPGGQTVPWLTASLSSVTAPAALTLQANATGLAVGTYAAQVSVFAAGADGSPSIVSISLIVSQNAIIILTPTSVAFTTTTGSSPSAATIAVSNGGGGVLTGLSLGGVQYGGGATGWLVATLSSSQAPAQVTLTPSSVSLPAGTYTASVPVVSSAVGVSPTTLGVTLTVRTAATIVASPASVALTATASQRDPSRIVGVTNGGSGALTGLSATTVFAPAQSSGWLTTTFPGGLTTAPTSMTLQALTSSLAVGSYTATVQLRSPDAPAPSSVNVTLDVTGQLLPGSFSLSFFGALGDGTSAPASTPISNFGAGFISGLSSSVSYSLGSGWLTRSLSSSTTPASLVVQLNPDGTAPRGTSLATVTIRGDNVPPVSVVVRRTIGYVYETHIVSGSFNVFDGSNLRCTNCHGPSSSRPIPFSSYSSMLTNGYIRAPVTTLADTATTRVYYYVTDPAISHGGGVYPKSDPGIIRLRDWISDGSRK